MKADVRNLAAGLAIVLFGLFFCVKAFSYDLGSSHRMGPGFFPLLVSIATMGTGLVILVPAIRRRVSDYEPISWRPLLTVIASVIAFGLGIRYLGLVPAVFGCVALSASADPAARPVPVALLAGATAIGCWVVFIVGLGLQIPAFGGF